jgi:hypothetical protein
MVFIGLDKILIKVYTDPVRSAWAIIWATIRVYPHDLSHIAHMPLQGLGFRV